MIKRAVGIESANSLSKFLEKDLAPFDEEHGKDDRASVDTAAMTYNSSETMSVTTTTTKDFRVRKLNHYNNHDDDATLPSIKSLVDTIDTIDDNDDDDDDDDNDEPNQLSNKRPTAARNHVRFTIEPENDDGSESSLVHASFNSHAHDEALKNHHYTSSSPTTTTACQQREEEEEEEEEESTILGCCPECNALLFILQSGNNNNNNNSNGISVMHSVCMVCSSKSLLDPSVDLQTKEHLLEDLSHSLDRIACRLAWHAPETSLERAQMEIGWALSKPSQQRDWQFLSMALTRAVADIDETYLQLWTNHEWAVQPTPLNELADIRRFVQETFPELRWKVATKDALLIYIVEQVNQATMGFDAHWMPSSEQEEDEDAWWPTSQENAELHEIRKFLLTQCQSCASNKFSLRTAERKVAQCVERLSWIRKCFREEETHQGLQQLLSNTDSAHQRTERLESQLADLHAHSLKRMANAATLFKSSATATTAATTTAPSTSAVEVRPLKDPSRESSSSVPVDDAQRATSSTASRSGSVEILPDEQSDASSHSSTEHTATAAPRFSASDEARLRQLLRSCSPRVTESASQLKRTLDSITSFLTQSKGWDVAAPDVVRVVAGVLDHWATNADSQAQSFLILEACARKNPGIEAIVSTSCISKVSTSMSRCPDHVVLQQNSCKFLSAMAEEARTFSVPSNDLTAATTAVATTMAKHQFNKTIQTVGCKMCYHLSLSSEEGMQESLQHFSRLVVNALCSLPQDVRVQKAACMALWHVARREGSHQLLGFVGAPDAVVATMRQHWSKASVVLPACGFLADMATLDPTSKDCVHGLGGLDTLVSALAHHQAHKEIVQTALEALRNLAFKSPSTQQALVATDGAVGTIVNAMYAHNRHAQVQVAGLGVLTQLSYTPGLAEQLLVRVGNNNNNDVRVTGLGVVFAAMGRHVVGGDASVQLLGWALVWRCLCRCPRFPRAAAKGIAVLILSMECFGQDADIQCHACGLLSHLLEVDADDSNRRKLVEEGAFRALLMAVLHHPANSVVQRFASSAISKLLREDPGLTNRAHELLLLTETNSNARRGSASSSSSSSSGGGVALVAGPQDIELILRKMQDNPSCRETQKNGLVFLSKIASPQRREHFGSNAMHTIVSIMSQHADDADIQFHGCAILLSVANTTNDNDIDDNDDEQCPPQEQQQQQQQQGNAVVKAVVAASKAHLDNPNVQTVTLKVLKLLAMNDEIRSTIVMHGGVVQMMEAITKHPNQVLVLRNGTSLVSYLVQREPNSFRSVRSTLLHAILQPMRNHPKDELIQTSCCRVVEQLSQFLQTKTLLVKADVVPRIVAAMRDFRTNYELQLHAFQTLKNLSTQQQARISHNHLGGDVEILVGLRNWPRDEALQLIGYDALATLWTNKKILPTAETTTTTATASAVVVGGRHPTTTTTPVVATSVGLLQQQQQQTNQQQTLLFLEAFGSTLGWHAKNPAVLRQALRALAQFIDSPDNLRSVQTKLPNIHAQIERAMGNHSGLKHMVQHVLMRIKV